MTIKGNYPRIAQAVFDTPIAMHPGKAQVAMRTFASQLLGQSVNVNVATFGKNDAELNVPDVCAGQLGNDLIYPVHRPRDRNLKRTDNGVAVIAVEGTLIHKGGWVGMQSGETSYQGLALQVQEAIADEAIKAVVFEFDSFGGQVAGCADIAYQISALSKLKATLGIVNDHALSAGYWLASQCNSIVMAEGGYAGSIGVIVLHQNISKALEKAGVEITILHKGAHKADSNPFEALPDEVRETIEAELDVVGQQFADTVAAGRGSKLNAKSALALEAQTYMGKAAVKVGLVDAIARPSEAYAAFVSKF